MPRAGSRGRSNIPIRLNGTSEETIVLPRPVVDRAKTRDSASVSVPRVIRQRPANSADQDDPAEEPSKASEPAQAEANDRTIVYADSLSPISRDDYKFSEHPEYLAAYRASLVKVAAGRCEILLTPHPSASDMKERMIGKEKLFDPNGCRDYAAAIGKRLDERVTKETAAK